MKLQIIIPVILVGIVGYNIFSDLNTPDSDFDEGAVTGPDLKDIDTYGARGIASDWPSIDENFDEVANDLLAQNYYLVIDGSGSMEGSGCSGGQQKLSVAKQALKSFVDKIPSSANVGVFAFDRLGIGERLAIGSHSDSSVGTVIDSIDAGGGTPLSMAVDAAKQALTKQAQKQLGYGEYHMVIVTDGEANVGYEPDKEVFATLQSSPIVVHTVGFCIDNSHSLNQPGYTLYKAADNPAALTAGLDSVLAEAPKFNVTDFGNELMQGHAKAAISLVIVGLIGIGAWKIIHPFLKANTQTEITDASSLKGTVAVAVDGWVGYFPLCSPEMKTRFRRDGYAINCIDDGANYRERFKKLDANEYDFAVATVDSYVLNGERYNYPGAIIAVIDESKGGDAIVARKSVVDSIEKLKAAKDLRLAYTPDSPSHHLVKSIAAHFDVPAFKNSATHIKANGSEEAYKALQSNKVDVAVLWEPDVTKAMESDEFIRLLGTEDTQQLIVDILVASRKVAKANDGLILTLLKNYFKTLKFYTDNPEVLEKDLAEYSDLKQSKVAPLLQGVAWANLNDNAELWYKVDTQGFSREALIASIESAVEILLENGDFKSNPLPNRDPYSIINSQFIGELQKSLGQAGAWTQAGTKTAGGKNIIFPVLSAEQWQRLQEVGSLKARKIAFSSGTSSLTEAGANTVDKLVKDLKHYPHYRIEVRGHTGIRGDPEVNLALSRDRAEAVLDYMLSAHEINNARVRAIGFGGSRPLKKNPNESSRAYSYRLPRVEIVLVRETI